MHTMLCVFINHLFLFVILDYFYFFFLCLMFFSIMKSWGREHSRLCMIFLPSPLIYFPLISIYGYVFQKPVCYEDVLLYHLQISNPSELSFISYGLTCSPYISVV